VVMAHVLREENADYWNNGNLAKCFLDCTFNLYNALQKEILRDIFYPELNMFERLEKNILEQSCKWLGGLRNKYLREETVAVFFKTIKSEDSKPTVQEVPPSPSPAKSWSAFSLIQMVAGLALSQSSPQKPAKLECGVCNVIFSGPESQEQHNNSEKHKKKMQAAAGSQNFTNQSSRLVKESKLECNVCNMTFSGPESQEQHNNSEKHKKKMEAASASQNAANQSSLLIKESKLECNVCDMIFSGPESQEQHINSEKHKKKMQAAAGLKNSTNQSSLLECDVCNMTFSGPESQKQHNDSDKHKKKISQMTNGFIAATKNQNPGIQSGVDLSCSICSMTFTGPESKKQHMDGERHKKNVQQTSDDQVSVFWCKPCNITCTSKVSLTEHEASRNHAKMLASM